MEAIVGATAQVALQNVLSSIQDIITKAKSYKKCLTQLSHSLLMVQGYLSDAETNKKISGQAVSLWFNQLQDLVFEADAVLDEVKYELLRRQVMNQNGGSEKVMDVLSCGLGRYFFNLKMVDKITDVTTELKRINEVARDFGLQTTIALASQTNTVRSVTPTERETESFSVEPDVVGREEYVLEIVEKLIAAPSQETVTVIPIVGMGGIGKTTVARSVFNDEKIRKHFGEKIWLSVSFNFDAASLFKMILEALTKEKVEVTSKQVALQILQKHLTNKSYLLVLDDVWNEENDKWDEFMKPLSTISNVNGNCIVVTTRNENVVSYVTTLPTHRLRYLSGSQCWSIIKAKVFKGTDVTEEFEKIGLLIAEKCGGLPLAAKVVGGLLRGKSEGDWRNILNNKLSDDGDDKIKKILKLSYDNLPSSSLKKCFAYCSVFPQDYGIRRQELIELWMAEGFLQVGMGDDMETAGSKIFNHLLQYSLFQDADRDIFGNIAGCKMHDLVHDLACSITKDMHKVRYLALESDDTNEPNDISPEQMKYLRTMFFKGKIANDMFSNFKHLHVLKLTSPEIKELPSVIGKLNHLRSLDISLTEVEWLPDSIGKLYHLQTLSIPIDDLKKLPNTIINLISLRHLHNLADTQLPPGVGKLTSLRTLEHYKVRDEKGCRIEELGKLKNLEGKLKIENLEMVKDKEEAELADLYRKPDIFKLVLKWNESSDDARQHENVLEGLQPHRHLKSLKIIGYGGINLPSWTMRMAARNNIEGCWESFNSLVEIKLKGFTQCEELPTLGHLRHLRFLKLYNFSHVRSIGISFYGIENCSAPQAAFPALETLKLLEMPELTEWLAMKRATTDFPCLKYLGITNCPKLKSVHSHLTCLEKFKVGGSAFSLTDLLCNTSSLEDLRINSLSGLEYLPGELFMKNRNLTRLYISNCPKLMRIVPGSLCVSLKSLEILYCENLKELPDNLSSLCNLKELWIADCPGLKSIPYDVRGQSQGLNSLQLLNIRRCKGLMELPIELLESCASSLLGLILDDLENLENLDTLIPCIGKMSRLEILGLMRIPKSIFPTEIGCLTSLKDLSIGGFSTDAVPFNDGLTTILPKYRSLKFLRLIGKQPGVSLPDSIQNLTDLQILRLEDFEIDHIPDWIGNLSSLYFFWITNCQNLIHLPSKEAMEKLTKLSELEISNCPLLKERCRPQSTHGDSEWHKISHIRYVEIDFEKLTTK